MFKGQKGFSAVEGLLIVLVLAVIGFGGYYIWDQQKRDKKTATETNNTEQLGTEEKKEETRQSPENIPEGWISYENKEQGFSFCIS
jgi:uncharacterized protein HemX